MPPKHAQVRGGKAGAGSKQPGEGQGAGRGQSTEGLQASRGGLASRGGKPSADSSPTPFGPGTFNPNDPHGRTFGFKSSSQSLDQDPTIVTGPRTSALSGGPLPQNFRPSENVPRSMHRPVIAEASRAPSPPEHSGISSHLPSPGTLDDLRTDVQGWRSEARAARVLEDIPFEGLVRMNEIQAALCRNLPRDQISVLVHHGHTLNTTGEPHYVATAVHVLPSGQWVMLYSGDDADTVMLAHRSLLMKSFLMLGNVYR